MKLKNKCWKCSKPTKTTICSECAKQVPTIKAVVITPKDKMPRKKTEPIAAIEREFLMSKR